MLKEAGYQVLDDRGVLMAVTSKEKYEEAKEIVPQLLMESGWNKSYGIRIAGEKKEKDKEKEEEKNEELVD